MVRREECNLHYMFLQIVFEFMTIKNSTSEDQQICSFSCGFGSKLPVCVQLEEGD